MAAFSLSPCTADRAFRSPYRPEPESLATLASKPGHSLATSHPLPPDSVLFDRSILIGAPAMAASKPADHLPAINRDQNGSCSTSKMESLKDRDESCSPTSCIRHGHLLHDAAAGLRRPAAPLGADDDHVELPPKMTTEGEYHSAGSSQREGGSSGAASRAAAGAHARSDAIPAFLRIAFRGLVRMSLRVSLK